MKRLLTVLFGILMAATLTFAQETPKPAEKDKAAAASSKSHKKHASKHAKHQKTNAETEKTK